MLYSPLANIFVCPPPTAGCTAKFLEIFSPQSEAAERNPYTFYLETLSGSSDNDVTLLMRTCNTQSEITVQGRQGLFINKLRATLRRCVVL